MKYLNSASFSHAQPDKVGVLITNLGTPDAPTRKALKRYLKAFLSDPRVVEAPRWLWWLALNGVILNIRPARSAKAYQTVWTERGSPLMFHTHDQAKALREVLDQAWGDNLVLDFAMRYGNPGIAEVLDRMLDQGVRKLLVLPLYPQYCASTTASTFDAISECLRHRRWIPELRFITQYHDENSYIQAVADKIRTHWQEHGRADRLVFSYHGIPERYLRNGDPYHCQCLKTSRLVAQNLGLDKEQYLTTFQSRFGREEWLKPYTDVTLKALPAEGVDSVQVVCPGFSADCLETIEEIGEENREYFLEAGGKRYEYIPALNADAGHIQALAQIVTRHLAGWQGNDDQGERQALSREAGAPN
ncbi:ferrochelatase [Bowmanella dokdonensis]|uniref:Ferrochelatase n=1 Tax=Bowmanella dokdonensis TaxID=751969 RepID=A0A939DNH7_9ALTE|nr:ferrochelatase [Bowmanella dokdonensis]MBN7825370.1 ferrochelatase [Bowmanella dokdonensis]